MNSKRKNRRQKSKAVSRESVNKKQVSKHKDKPLPGSKKLRSKSPLLLLPNEIWVILLGFLSEHEKIGLALTSRSAYQKVWNLWLHEAGHQCEAQVEVCFASLKKDNGVHQESDNIFCMIFPWRRHGIRISYDAMLL